MQKADQIVAGILNPTGRIVAFIDEPYCDFEEEQCRFDLADIPGSSKHLNGSFCEWTAWLKDRHGMMGALDIRPVRITISNLTLAESEGTSYYGTTRIHTMSIKADIKFEPDSGTGQHGVFTRNLFEPLPSYCLDQEFIQRRKEVDNFIMRVDLAAYRANMHARERNLGIPITQLQYKKNRFITLKGRLYASVMPWM